MKRTVIALIIFPRKFYWKFHFGHLFTEYYIIYKKLRFEIFRIFAKLKSLRVFEPANLLLVLGFLDYSALQSS